MAWLSAVLGFFEALPKIIGLCERLVGVMKDKQVQAWMSDLENTIDKTEKAKTIEEKRDAAKSIVNIIRRIGS